MFEHVGRRRLREYFAAIQAMLAPDGLFLNHGIAGLRLSGLARNPCSCTGTCFPAGNCPI
jgi:cyclopropane fatty-acyl-phospholipid synthase-like methyltransferase